MIIVYYKRHHIFSLRPCKLIVLSVGNFNVSNNTTPGLYRYKMLLWSSVVLMFNLKLTFRRAYRKIICGGILSYCDNSNKPPPVCYELSSCVLQYNDFLYCLIEMKYNFLVKKNVVVYINYTVIYKQIRNYFISWLNHFLHKGIRVVVDWRKNAALYYYLSLSKIFLLT